jgi:hypothetical protein
MKKEILIRGSLLTASILGISGSAFATDLIVSESRDKGPHAVVTGLATEDVPVVAEIIAKEGLKSYVSAADLSASDAATDEESEALASRLRKALGDRTGVKVTPVRNMGLSTQDF